MSMIYDKLNINVVDGSVSILPDFYQTTQNSHCLLIHLRKGCDKRNFFKIDGLTPEIHFTNAQGEEVVSEAVNIDNPYRGDLSYVIGPAMLKDQNRYVVSLVFTNADGEKIYKFQFIINVVKDYNKPQEDSDVEVTIKKSEKKQWEEAVEEALALEGRVEDLEKGNTKVLYPNLEDPSSPIEFNIPSTDDSPESELDFTQFTTWEFGQGESAVQTRNTDCRAKGDYSVAEGLMSHAGVVDNDNNTDQLPVGLPSNDQLNMEGWNEARGAHAEGGNTYALGDYSHTEGNSTVANNPYEHAQGVFNISHMGHQGVYPSADNTIHSIGIGSNLSNRKNAEETMENGDKYIIGLGGFNGTNPDEADTIQDVINGKVDTDAIVDNAESEDPNVPLSANMGRELNQRIDNLAGRGRFLSTWDCTTGLADTLPTTDPYEYKPGDYFIVSTIATEDGQVNYRPFGTEYSVSTPSTDIETEDVKPNDDYWFDGTVWILQKNTIPELVYDNELSDTSENAVQNKVITKHLNEFGRIKCIKFTYDSTSNTYSCEYTFSELLDLLEDEDNKDVLFYAMVDGYSQDDPRNVPYYLVRKNSTVVDFDAKEKVGDTSTYKISYYSSGSIGSMAVVTSSWFANKIKTSSAIGSASQSVYVNSSGEIVASNNINLNGEYIYIYVDPVSGNDNNTGLSSNSKIKSWSKMVELVNRYYNGFTRVLLSNPISTDKHTTFYNKNLTIGGSMVKFYHTISFWSCSIIFGSIHRETSSGGISCYGDTSITFDDESVISSSIPDSDTYAYSCFIRSESGLTKVIFDTSTYGIENGQGGPYAGKAVFGSYDGSIDIIIGNGTSLFGRWIDLSNALLCTDSQVCTITIDNDLSEHRFKFKHLAIDSSGLPTSKCKIEYLNRDLKGGTANLYINNSATSNDVNDGLSSSSQVKTWGKLLEILNTFKNGKVVVNITGTLDMNIADKNVQLDNVDLEFVGNVTVSLNTYFHNMNIIYHSGTWLSSSITYLINCSFTAYSCVLDDDNLSGNQPRFTVTGSRVYLGQHTNWCTLASNNSYGLFYCDDLSSEFYLQQVGGTINYLCDYTGGNTRYGPVIYVYNDDITKTGYIGSGDDNGIVIYNGPHASVPQVTSADNGKVLAVEDGVWKAVAPKYEIYQLLPVNWYEDSTIAPFTCYALVSPDYNIGSNTTVELINNDPVLFANHGFAIKEITSDEDIKFVCIKKPTESVMLKVRFEG